MLVYQKNMFDRYYYIKSFSYLETLKYAPHKHEGFVAFENACSRAKAYVILMSLNYVHFFECYC